MLVSRAGVALQKHTLTPGLLISVDRRHKRVADWLEFGCAPANDASRIRIQQQIHHSRRTYLSMYGDFCRKNRGGWVSTRILPFLPHGLGHTSPDPRFTEKRDESLCASASRLLTGGGADTGTSVAACVGEFVSRDPTLPSVPLRLEAESLLRDTHVRTWLLLHSWFPVHRERLS